MSGEENRAGVPPQDVTAQDIPTEDAEPEDEALSEEEEQRHGVRRRRLLIACALFLIIDLAVVAVFGMNIIRDRQAGEDARAIQEEKLGITPDMTEEEREERIAQVLGEASRYVTLRSVMKAWDGKADMYLSNKEESTCGVAVQLVLLETGETIAHTDVVEPGWHVVAVEMDEKVKPGEYQCLAICLFYTMDDNAYLGRTARQVLLTVE